MIKTVNLSPGADGVFIRSDRFKTTRISVNFFLPLSGNTISANTILPSMLTTSCSQYPDYKSLHKKLDSLYGASLNCTSGKVGDYNMLTLSIVYLSDKYAGEAIGSDCAKLLAGMIFRPNLDENGRFKANDIEREKRLLIENIQGELNNKRLYAISKAEAALCKDDVYGLPQLGTAEGAAALTEKDIYAAWRRALEEAYVRVSVVGEEYPENIFEIFKNGFGEIGRQDVKLTKSAAVAPVSAPERVTEQMDVAQGKLVMAFTTGVTGSLPDTAAFAVMADLFGGGPYSRLFTNVREKLSLCYYCAARPNRFKGIMLVDSGVEKENAAAAEKEILNQLEIVKRGEFTDEELKASVLGKTDRIRTILDSQRETESFYLSQVFDDTSCTLEEELAAVSSVTREQVVKAAEKIQLSLTYMLSPKEDDGNE